MKIIEFYTHQFIKNNLKDISGECLIIKPESFELEVNKLRLPQNYKTVSIDKFLNTKFTKLYDSIIAINLFNETLEYDKAVEKVFKLLKEKGNLLSTTISRTDAGKNLWGFTVPSLQILLGKYFNKKYSNFEIFGNALAGKYLIENIDILTSYEKAQLNLTDVHFGVMVGFTGQKTGEARKSKPKPINILVDEDKQSLKGYLVSILKRGSYFLDLPLKIIRAIRSYFNRAITPYDKYIESNSHKPVTNNYGYSRGKPIDRFYIEKFLNENRKLIKGKCLEIVDNTYTLKFGGDQVTVSDALDIFPSQRANIQGDLRNLVNVPNNTYDTLVITQTFFLIDDYESAISESYRILKPGGVIIATLSTMSPSWNVSVNMWRFSAKSARYIFQKFFGKRKVTSKNYGNKISVLGFWLGFAQEDFTFKKLNTIDEKHPLIIGVVAKK